VGVHVGDGRLVHAMATEKTMRGWWGSLADAATRVLGARDRHVGVLSEPLAAFLERFERDTWVIVRHPALDEAQRARGVAHVNTLVGRAYDYEFRDGNEAIYCTEVADEFLRAALGDAAPALPRTRHRVPLLLDQLVIDPVALLRAPPLVSVAANAAAHVRYGKELALGNVVAA